MKYHDLELAFDALSNYKRAIEGYRPGMKCPDIQEAMKRIHLTLLQAKKESEARMGTGMVAIMLDCWEIYPIGIDNA